MKKEQKKQPEPKDFNPKELELVVKNSDLIVCAKIGASMRNAISNGIKAVVKTSLEQYRDAAMLIISPTKENSEMISEMIRDQLKKALEESVKQLTPESFLSGDTKWPAGMLATDVECEI